jgi:uncharacterized protein (TIGR03435 family)
MRRVLGIALAVAVLIPGTIITAAQNQALKFEVASVKPSPQSLNVGVINGCSGTFPRVNPGRFTVTGATLYTLITWAYSMGECLNVSASGLVSGGPGWIISDRFDIQANIPQSLPAYTTEGIMRGHAPKLASMIEALLADRFKLALHREMREIPVYALTVAKGGPKFTLLKEGDCDPRDIDFARLTEAPARQDQPRCGDGRILIGFDQKGTADVRAMDLDDFAQRLGLVLDRPVINQTGITNMVAFHLDFVLTTGPPRSLAGLPGPPRRPTPEASPLAGPSIFTALQEQVGLKLDATKASVPALVIDHAEKPDAN